MSAKPAARLLFLGVALCSACAFSACATTAPDTDPTERRDDGMPFIKLARRDMALVMYFAGDEIRPGSQEDIERRIAQRLKNTYRTPVLTYRRSGAFIHFPPELVLELSEKSIDDVVIVEIATDSRDLHGHVQVIALVDQRVIVDRKFQVATPAGGGVPAAKLADAAWLAVARYFTDPGASPELDIHKVADQLADESSCKQAVSLYARVLKGRRPVSISEARRYDASLEKQAECKRKIAAAEEMEADRVAVFTISLDVQDLPPRLEEAVRAVFRKGRLEGRLRSETNKPVFVRVTPAAFSLSLRFDAAYLQKAIDGRPARVDDARMLYLDAYYTIMGSLSEFREEVADSIESRTDSQVIRDLPMTLKLTKPGGDSAAIDFATLDDRVLLTDTLRMRLGGSQEIPVQTEAKHILREGSFVLGSPNDKDGALTAPGIVYKFFELTP